MSAEYVTQQPADGYTLMVGPSGTMALAAAIYSDLKYSPTKDFVPLAMIAHFPLIMVVGADNPVEDRQGIRRMGESASRQDELRQLFAGLHDHRGAFEAELRDAGRDDPI